MATTDKLTKRVVFQLDTDLSKINQQINEFEKNLKQAKWAEREAKAEGDEHKLSLIAQRKAVEELREQRKKADSALKQHTKSTKDAEAASRLYGDSIKKLVSNQAMAVAKGILITKGLQMLTGAFSDAIERSGQMQQVMASYTGDIEGARKATKGLVGDLELMTGQNKLNVLGVKMSNDEYNSLLEKLTKISGAMNIDMNYALESATTMLARSSVAVADNIGVVIKAEEAYKEYAESIGKTASELTGSEKKIAFQTEALKQLADKAAELPDRIDTINDSFKRWMITFDRLGFAITQTDTFKASISALGEVTNTLADYTETLSKSVGEYSSKQIQAKKATSDFFRSLIGGAVAAIPILGQLYSFQHNANKAARDEEYKTSHAAAKEAERIQSRLDSVWGSWKSRQSEKLRAEEQAISAASSLNKKAEDDEKKSLAERRRLNNSSAKLKKEESKSDYDDHVDLYRKHIREMNKLVEKEAKYQFKVENKLHDQRIKIAKDANAKTEELAIKAREKAVEIAEENRQKITEINLMVANTFWQSANAAMLSAESMGDFGKLFAANVLDAISRVAMGKAAEQTALALGALGITWGFPNPSSTAHFASAAGWALLAGGVGLASAAGASGIRSGIASDKQEREDRAKEEEAAREEEEKEKEKADKEYKKKYLDDNYRSTSITSARASERGGSGTSVTNIFNIRGRSDLLTKKDIQTVGKKLAQGRS